MKDSRERLSHTTIALHWVVALFVIMLMGVGMYMAENEVRSLYPLHKSMGMVALVFILWRVIYRLMNGFPPAAANYKAWEQTLSKVVHWVLLIGTLLFPFSGMIMSAMGGHGLYLFGLEVFASNPNPAMPGKNMPINKELAGFAKEMHETLGPIMLVAIVLHIAGAYKHHLMDKDGTLRRMLGRALG